MTLTWATQGIRLDDTGVVVAMPRFKPYPAWTRAQRLGAGDQGRTQEYYIVSLCTFDGERLSVEDYRDLVPANDHLQILGRVFGGPKGDDAGK